MAELLVASSRQLGLAARFVSGYVYEPPPLDGTAGFNRAAGSMHAWAEVYLPGAGWRGFDPTNGILTDHRFLPAAVAEPSGMGQSDPKGSISTPAGSPPR